MDPITKRLITSFKEKGFRIKFPGGNERQDSFAAFVLILRYNLDRKLWQAIVLPWRPRTLKEEKDNEEISFPELPIQAAIREVGEETGITLIQCEFLTSREIKDKRDNYQGKMHTQYVFTSQKFDASNKRRNPSPSQPNIDIPFWMDVVANELREEIAIEHQWIVEVLLEHVTTLPIPNRKFEKRRLYKKGRRTSFKKITKYRPAVA